MSNEIGRKFLIKTMPDLAAVQPISFERYYIYRDSKNELRIQKLGDHFEIERKEIINQFKAEKSTMKISDMEFNKLKTLAYASQVILRDSYILSKNPETTINIYHGRFEGFKRVEVEFETEEEAKSFTVPDWFGEEITDSIISRDAKLIDITDKDLQPYISR